MKKVSLLLCALLAAASLLAGCTPAAPAATKAPVASEAPAATAAPAESAAPADTEASAAPVTAVSDGTPSGSFGAFSTMKSAALQRLTDKFGANADLAMDAMTILPFTMVDLAVLPVTALTGNAQTDNVAATAALGMLGMKDVKINQAGDKYTVTYSDSKDKKGSLTCEYDAATDSMRNEVTDETGKVVLICEYVKVGKGYACQYYDVESTGTQVLTAIFDDSNLSAIGITDTTKEPASIYKNANLTVDFVKAADTYFLLQDGKLTVHEKGEDKTY